MKKLNNHRQYYFLLLLPIIGCLLFVILYIIAAAYYPGGNHYNKNAAGFSWYQNYWCNLLSNTAINGETNKSKPFAFTAMVVLAMSLIIFWYSFPKLAGFTTGWSLLTRASGVIAMVTSVFIFTNLHDTIINVAGLFGLIALTGTLMGLKNLGLTHLFYMGILVVMLIALNNLLYYQKSLMYYLPVVQKITFLIFLLWVCLINSRLLYKIRNTG